MLATESYEGICPNCGQWLELNEATGFCIDCSAEAGGFNLCNKCHTNRTAIGSTLCEGCRTESFLLLNADSIEECMLAGMTFGMAVTVTRRWNSTSHVCFSCGGFLRGRRHPGKASFCRHNKQCQQAARRLRTLKEHFMRQRYANPYETALEQLRLELDS